MLHLILDYWILFAVALLLVAKGRFWMEYYVKFGVFLMAAFLAATILPLPLFILRPKDYRNALGPAWACRQFLRLLGVSYEIRGTENIRKESGGVVLINHQSFIDLAVLAHLWPIIGRATVVAKRLVLFFFPPAYGWGTLFIDRSNRHDAMDRLNKEATAIRERAVKLLVFPEGTRGGQTDRLLPFKKGPFHIAVQSQSSLQPVVVSRYTFLDSNTKRFVKGHTIISILPEINCANLEKSSIPQLIERAQTFMQREYDLINKEIQTRGI